MSVTVPSTEHTVAPAHFTEAFRHHPAGVVVVTVDSGHGPAGFTATSLSSLSLDPPLVCFGIGVGSSSWPHLERATTVVVNFLAATQEFVARRFATSGIDRFGGPTAWHRLPTGEPALDGVAGRLRATVERLVPAGDHRLVIARVTDAWRGADQGPLVYHDGAYHTF